MDPEKWGYFVWRAMHIVTATAALSDHEATLGLIVPSAVKTAQYRAIRLLPQVLPCRKCRVNFAKHIANHNPTTYNPESAPYRYLLELHNLVNAELGRQTRAYVDPSVLFYNYYSSDSVPYAAIFDTFVMLYAMAMNSERFGVVTQAQVYNFARVFFQGVPPTMGGMLCNVTHNFVGMHAIWNTHERNGVPATDALVDCFSHGNGTTCVIGTSMHARCPSLETMQALRAEVESILTDDDPAANVSRAPSL